LSNKAEEVIVFDIDEIRLFRLNRIVNDERLKCFLVDIRDPKSIERAFNRIGNVDVLFHAAALKHVVVCEENPIEATLTNVIGTQNIVDIAVKFHVPKSILISTDKAVNPINVMGATKFIAEKIFLGSAHKYTDQSFAIVRFGNVANSRGSVIPIFIESLLRRKEIVITDPHVTRFIMRIQNAVGLTFKSLDISVGGEIFALKMQSFKLGDLADTMINHVAPHLGIAPDEIRVKTIGLVKGEKMHEELFKENESDRVMDLGDFYVIIDSKTFPKHEKYLTNPNAMNIMISSQQTPRISSSKLKKFIFDYLSTIEQLSKIS